MGSLDEIQKELMYLRKRCKVVLIAMHDQADRDMPDIGSIMFATPASKALIDTSNMRARELYRTAWETYNAALSHICKKFKAPLVWLDTAIDPVKGLFVNAGSMLKWKN